MRTLAILFIAALQLMNGRSYAALASGGKSGDVPDGERLLKKKQKGGKRKSKSKSPSASPTSGPTNSPFPTYNPTSTQYPTPVCNLPTKSNLFTVERDVEKVVTGSGFIALVITSGGGSLLVTTSGGTGGCGLLVFQTAPGLNNKLVCEQGVPGGTGNDHSCDITVPSGSPGGEIRYDVVLAGSCENVHVLASNTSGD